MLRQNEKVVNKSVCAKCHKEFIVPKDYDPKYTLWCRRCRADMIRLDESKRKVNVK